MSAPDVVAAALVWTGEEFRSGIRVEIADGVIGRVGALDAVPTRSFPRCALLPGFVNAHSHAFQRGLRGAGEVFPAGAGSFWTWREAMYDLVQRLDRETLAAWCRLAFDEMLDAGITTVGEFHYLHHETDADGGLDDVVLEAAAAAGIRLVLLNAYYRTGGFGRPLEAGQRRFATPSLTAYWAGMDRLAERLRSPEQSLGVAAHSLRAVPLDDLRDLHRESLARGHVFHLHLEEQRREVDECLAAYGRTPMHTLLDTLETVERVTAVHCTHTRAADFERFLAGGGRACICPLTEANLGDGIPALTNPATGHRISLGTDSNARIGMWEEMRWLEYGQRLREERRGLLVDARGDVATRLISAATGGGGDALGIHVGRIASGYQADLVAVDLDCRALASTTPETLAAALVTGADNTVIADVCVAGRWRSERDGGSTRT